MALTRKLLKGMGLTDEQVDTINITAEYLTFS